MIAATIRLTAAALAVACATFAASADESARALTIQAAALSLSTGEEPRNVLGKLVHRGTLRLTSPDNDFGGLSGLIVSDDGERFLAITDSSHWLTGTLSYSDGKLTGVGGSEIGPLLDPDGKPLQGKGGDAEGLAGSIGGDVFVSFEGGHRIWRYAFAARGLAAHAERVDAPADLAQAPFNSGLEGIALLSDGRLLALTESFTDDAGNYRGWLIPRDDKSKIEGLTLKPRPPFKLTDVRQLPDGDVLTLERRFSVLGGVGFEMRRIPGNIVAKGAILDGAIVADAGANFIIDNMEGLAVRQGSRGETLVYVVSDDNFNAAMQQTLIMMFELKDAGTPSDPR